jgi:predicted transcriptional regulator
MRMWNQARTPAPAEPWIPDQVEKLASREREVATLIYVHGQCTAKQVQARLSADLSNGAVRSMLVRLVSKGVLDRRWGKRGRSHEFVYLPAITSKKIKLDAIRRLTAEYFDGSLAGVSLVLAELVEDQDSASAGPHRTAI